RFLDSISGKNLLQEWIPLQGKNKGRFKVIMNTHGSKTIDAERVFDDRKADHKILNAAIALQEENPEKKVDLVTKDINLRLKAKEVNVIVEDYETGKI